MAGQTCHYFKTRAEADAFADGVKYVNDSAIEVVSITRRTGRTGGRPWTVTLRDEDA